MESVLEIILKLVDKASGGVKGVASSLGGLEDKAAKAHNRLLPLSNMFGTILKAGAVTATAAVGGLAAGIVSATLEAADMEQKIADIASVMGVGADAIKPLKGLIQDLGMDPRLKVDATEAGIAIEMLAKNGLTMTQVMDGAARNTVLLANATGAEFGTAADIATDVMVLFNIEAQEMMSAVNGITGVTTKSKFGINDYRLAIAQAGGVASAVGVEFDDFNAVIAAIAPSFASGSDAGTSFKTFLQRLVPDTNPAKEAMTELGLLTVDASGKMQNAFFTASGEMKSMGEISQALHIAMKDLSDEQRIQALTTMFGTDAMRAASAMAGMTEESFNKLKLEIAKVDAEQAAKTRMDTLRGSMEILTGVFDGLKIQIGDKFIPVFKNLVDRIAQFLSDNSDKIVAWAEKLAAKIEELLPAAEAILGWMVTFVTTGEKMTTTQMGLTGQTAELVNGFISFVGWIENTVRVVTDVFNALGGLKVILTTIGALLGISVIAQVIGFISSIVGAVGAVGSFIGALTGLGPLVAGIAALFGPVTLAVAAVGAAIAVLYSAWQGNWFGIRDVTGQAIQGIKGWLDKAPGWLQEAGPKLYEAGRGAFLRVSEAIGSLRAHTQSVIQTVLSDVKEHGYAYAVGAFAGRLAEGARSAVISMFQGFQNAAPNASADIQQALNGIINTFNFVMDGFRTHVWSVMWSIGENIGKGLMGGINHLMNDIQNVIRNLTNRIPQWIRDQLGIHSPSEVMRSLGKSTMEGFVLGMQDLAVQPQLVLEQAITGVGSDSVSQDNSQRTTNWNINMTSGGGAATESQMIRLTNTLTSVYSGGRF
jgi:TP901 family phage tail tape measure protein